MTDYSKMDHQKLYDYAQSGNPEAMNSTAESWQRHSQALEQATSELQSNLTAIQSQWQGAAADAYFQQSQSVAAKMQTHADNAANTGTAVTNTASALSWARSNMPDPPSWLEQQTANIDSNIVSGAIGFLSTGGAATAASELAKRDIENKHNQAISVMTQLAGAYTSARAQLPASTRIDDPSDGNGNGNGNGTFPVMPVPVYPIGGTGGGGGGYSGGAGNGGHYGGGAGGVGSGSGFGSGTGGGSTGGGSGVKVPSYSDSGGATFTQGAGGAGGTSNEFGGSHNPYASNPYGATGGTSGGAGGTAGTGGLGAGGLGAGAGAGYGAGKGGTSLGAGESTGAGTLRGRGAAGSRYGSAAAKVGEGGSMVGGAAAEGEGRGQSGAMMGGMGGRGGAGGGGEERGNRAGFLRQDPDYWYGDKQAAPPGGVIE